MATAKSIPKTIAKRGLGRGLSALIPDDDMEFLSRVARGEAPAAPVIAAPDQSLPAPSLERDAANNRANADIQPLQTSRDDVAAAEPVAAGSTSDAEVVAEGAASTQWVDVSSIEANPYQPRRHFSQEELDDLAASIRTHGVLQPILVRPAEAGTAGRTGVAEKRYQLVAGERRWRAARIAGLNRVPAIIRDVADQQALELALIENVQRHDISAMDAALAYRRLATEFKLSQEHIARRVGKSRSAVANTLRLLDLPEAARKAIEDGVISEGHGRAILLASGEGTRRAVLRRIVRDHMSVREAERLAQQPAAADANAAAQAGQSFPGRAAKESADNGRETGKLTSDLRRAEAQLQKALGTRLRLRPRGKGGTLVMEYSSSDELQRIIELLTTVTSSQTRS